MPVRPSERPVDTLDLATAAKPHRLDSRRRRHAFPPDVAAPPVPRPLGGARPGALREGEHRAAHLQALRAPLRAAGSRRAGLLLLALTSYQLGYQGTAC